MFVERVGVDSVSEVNREPKSVRKFLNGSSAGKHDYQAEVDINSSDLSSIQNCQKKKKKQARKKRESSSCSIGSLGSDDEGALSSTPVVQDNTERQIPSNHLGIAEDGSSVLGGGEISQEVASVGPNSEILSGEKKKKSKRKKKRELTACPMTSLGSTEEGASPLVLVVPDSSVGEISLKQSDEVPALCNSVKLMEEVVVGNGTSLLDGGKISREIGFGECPNGESEFGKMKEKSKMGNLEDDKTSNGRLHRRKKRKSSACRISSLESIEEGVQESSAAYTGLNHLNEAPEPSYSGKMKEEMVAGLIISQEKASGECPNGQPACGNQREKSKMGNLEERNAGNTVVMNVSLVDIPDTDFEQDSSVRDILSNHLGKTEDGSSVPAIGEISQEKASSGPNSELLPGKKKKESKRKKKRKLSDCPMYSLGSTEEGASPSVLVVPDSSVGQMSLKQSDKVPAPCNLVKLMEEVVAGNGTSLLDGGKISQEIYSGECPNGKSDFGKKKEDSKMGNLEEDNAGHSRIHRRKKRKSFACSIGSLESTEESLQESSAGYTCLNHMDKAPEPSYTGKMMEEVVVGLGISQEKASCECPVGEPSSGKRRKKSKMEKKLPVMDVFMVDIPETDFEHFNKDKLDVIQNTLLSKEDRASYDALGSVPSVDNLNIRPMLKGAIPSSSKLGAIDGVSLESPQQPQGGAPLGNLRKKLLVLDVNGLLADIVPCGTGEYKPHKVLSQKAVFKRPFCDDFLQFCFDRFHSDYTKTGYKTVENREKPLLLKELKKLWEKHRRDLPWARGEYNESNTLLLDDSPYKALRNPPNTAIFPHSYCYKDTRDDSLGQGGAIYGFIWKDWLQLTTFKKKGENATNDPSDYQQQEEDASNDSLASQQQEEDTTEYS